MTKKQIVTGRRTFLLSLGATVGAGALGMTSKSRQLSYQPEAISDETRDFSVIGEAPLRERAAAKGLIYGSSAQFHELQNPKFAARFVQECAILVPELELKWAALRPSPERFDFVQADAMAEFARKHNMLFRGAPLVWYQALPKWFKDTVNRQNAEQMLVNHIQTVVGRYAGRMHSWDVVNEAIELTDNRADGLRKTPWLKLLGPGYIDLAFRTAAEADPNALLVYNEHQLHSDKFDAKRTAVLRLLERLKSNGTPVHALGMQGHLGRRSWNESQARNLRNFLRDVASLGLKILETEMDVTDKSMPLDISVRDRIIAGVYEDYLSILLEEPAVIAVMTWGLSDRYTWLSSYAPRKDRKPVRPLVLDAQMNRKLAWNATARAFDKAPMREGDNSHR